MLTLVTLSISQYACDKQLDVKAADVASEEFQWTSISDTKAGLIGMYGLLRAAMYESNGHWVFGEMRSGDFVSYTRADLSAVHSHDLKASYPLIKTLTDWRRFYAVINAASLFIERAPEVYEKDKRYTEVNLKWDIAQARTIRAFTYFYMSRIWGDVPLLRKSFDDGEFLERPRNTKETVLAFAEQELLAAAEDLPYTYGLSSDSYYDENFAEWHGVLFNKLTAYAVLSHIAVWQERYMQADVYSKFVLENYSSIALDYSSIAELTGRDGVFSNQSLNGQLLALRAPYLFSEATATGHIEEWTLAAPLVNKKDPSIYVPKDTITSLFPEPNDTRFGIDTLSGLTRTNYFTNFNGETPIFSKIKVIRDGATNEAAYSVFGSSLLFTRLEEMTLLRAEILAVLNQESEAIRLLNVIKALRQTTTYTARSSEDLLTAIFQERRRELMGEGWRWYDQIRFNRIHPVDPLMEELIDNDGIYWPLAGQVLNNNSLLEQNSYWK